ncbi:MULTISPECIES: isocitrate lyase/phosphoenolpyruvate mutase family protein [unclassified Streptomyces]|uniref:isocitrate lyase/PEP mutase family protein n=1 Tax=unclassified Streptomyces TaxID=2593676 RepID=UPI000DC7E273|nr:MULTISPECIES: isocitrate lyase/phosphoenolpyruvate mutase family protein [unclassified Streptomyces]AWZ06517.1 isocitrate lyase/phosphoenolpyruvate mutase family protein [Streptomyces sp. ICC4]AWZ14158.1 isocitrate lyase/phosphoenolpyruvate mutase family protein [Streptomyces sp. ICC1]
MTVDAKSTEKALRLRALGEGLLVLPNAWDAASAAVIEAAGASAIATTSGGVAWGIGRGDGQHAPRARMLEAAARIVAAVDLPVTVDVEGGYEDVGQTVREVVAVGAVGINLEDSKASDGTLYTAAEQAGRIRAAREAAAAAGLPELVVNARTDVFLFGIGEEPGRLADVLARVEAYAAAGADGIFVPGLLDLAALAEIARGPLPVNAMAGPGGPSVAELAAAGVRRVSVGTAVAQAAYSAARAAAEELLGQGTYGALGASLDYGTLNGLFVK